MLRQLREADSPTPEQLAKETLEHILAPKKPTKSRKEQRDEAANLLSLQRATKALKKRK
jgi:hypothetical protein